MPVEDRLRQGLEANATSFTPRGETRLEQVHRRRRRHTAAVAASLALTAAVLAAVVVQVVPGWSGSTPPTADDCSPVRGRTAPEEDPMDKRTIAAAVTVAALASACDPVGGTSRNPTGDTSPGSASSTGGPRLPERGGWVREVTAKRGRALGVPARTVRRLAGEDGVLPLGFKLEMGNFTIWTNDDDGEATAWDYGSYSYRSGHRLEFTTISNTCPSCTTTLTWRTIDGDVVFDPVDRTRSAALARWLWQGRWDYQAPGAG